MKWNQVFGLLCLLVLILPNAFILNPPSTPAIENRFQDDTPVLNSASTLEETSKTTSTSIDASSEPLPPEEEPIENQDPPSSLTGAGAPRGANLYWNDTRGFLDRDNGTDVQVPLEVKGCQFRFAPFEGFKGFLDDLFFQTAATQGSENTPVLHDDHLGPSLSRG